MYDRSFFPCQPRSEHIATKVPPHGCFVLLVAKRACVRAKNMWIFSGAPTDPEKTDGQKKLPRLVSLLFASPLVVVVLEVRSLVNRPTSYNR